MRSKKISSPVATELASFVQTTKKQVEELLSLIPSIWRTLEVFDRKELQSAWNQNETINRIIQDEIECLLEFSLDNSFEKEMVKIRPILNNLHNLEMINKHFSDFMEEIKIRITENIIFSDRAFRQLSYLWKAISEILRELITCFNSPQKCRSDKLISRSTQIFRLLDQYDIEHEERLIRGICAFEASAVFLTMLDSIRGIVRCLSNISANF